MALLLVKNCLVNLIQLSLGQQLCILYTIDILRIKSKKEYANFDLLKPIIE